jgi:hypothetical protein
MGGELRNHAERCRGCGVVDPGHDSPDLVAATIAGSFLQEESKFLRGFFAASETYECIGSNQMYIWKISVYFV